MCKHRLTNADVAKLSALGFGPELSDIILRNLIRVLGDKCNDPADFRLSEFFLPIDFHMIEEGLYTKGDIVNCVGEVYICLMTGTLIDPRDDDGTSWLPIVANRY